MIVPEFQFLIYLFLTVLKRCYRKIRCLFHNSHFLLLNLLVQTSETLVSLHLLLFNLWHLRHLAHFSFEFRQSELDQLLRFVPLSHRHLLAHRLLQRVNVVL